jgi:hypothetical protein
MRLWHGLRGAGYNNDQEYLSKGGLRAVQGDEVELAFHETNDLPQGSPAARRALHVRSAYRNDPEFSLHQLQRLGSLLEVPVQTAQRMIDNDVRVTENYQRMVGLSLDDLYSGRRDGEPVEQVREHYVGELRDALKRLFSDLELRGPGDPLGGGTFRFRKGIVEDFPYKNLSGGEKAAFDLLLDLVVKKAA